MKVIHRLPFLLLLLAAGGAAAQNLPPAGGKLRLAGANAVPDRYIVVLADDATDHRGAPQLLNRRLVEREQLVTGLALAHNARVERLWFRAFSGFSARLARQDAEALAADPRVLLVEQVSRGMLSPAYTECSPPATHEEDALPAVTIGSDQKIDCDNPVPGQDGCRDNWGLDRIDQRNVDGGNPPALSDTYLLPAAGATVHAYLLDTGITLGHREFKNAQGGSRIGAGVNVPLSTGSGGVAATGTHSLGITTNSSLANLDFWSRESMCRPRLEVVVSP
jgi:hypothetical protein